MKKNLKNGLRALSIDVPYDVRMNELIAEEKKKSAQRIRALKWYYGMFTRSRESLIAEILSKKAEALGMNGRPKRYSLWGSASPELQKEIAKHYFKKANVITVKVSTYSYFSFDFKMSRDYYGGVIDLWPETKGSFRYGVNIFRDKTELPSRQQVEFLVNDLLGTNARVELKNENVPKEEWETVAQ